MAKLLLSLACGAGYIIGCLVIIAVGYVIASAMCHSLEWLIRRMLGKPRTKRLSFAEIEDETAAERLGRCCTALQTQLEKKGRPGANR